MALVKLVKLISVLPVRGEGLLFRKGQVVRKVPEETMVEELKEIDVIAAEMAAEREKEKETQEQ